MDSFGPISDNASGIGEMAGMDDKARRIMTSLDAVSYTHLRAHETVLDLVCRLLLEKKKYNTSRQIFRHHNTSQTF